MSGKFQQKLALDSIIDGRYKVIEHIGSGGMGEVYKVQDELTQTTFALKMISPELSDQATLARRLEHEAKAARTLVHGNIVTVYDVGRSDDVPYLLMDFVAGESLENLLATEIVLQPSRALSIFMQIAEALVHAQQKGVVHRDLKPSNILISKTANGEDLVKIVDFGIAKISDQDSVNKTKLTQTGELLGTPLYMSPEQCTGDELDARSDIYSFGCIMYETLVGKSPFAADNQVKVILKHLSDELPPFPKNVGISEDLKEVIGRCLARNQSQRYQKAVDLQIDLERVHDGRKISVNKNKPRIGPKQKKLAAIVGCALIGLIGIGTIAQVMYINRPMPLPPVQANAHRPERYDGKTLTQWTTAIEADPDDPKLYFSRAILHQLRDERQNQIDDLSSAIKLKPNFLEAYKARATAYALTAQYDKSATDANQLIKLAPDSASSYETRGWVYASRDQFAEALQDFEHAIDLSPNPYYYYHRAILQLKLAQYAKAEESVARAVSSKYSPALGVGGLVYTFQQKYPEAEKYFIESIGSNDARAVEWQMYSYYLACFGKLDEAQTTINRAKSLETFPARSFRLAGEYYRTTEQYEKAVQEFSASTSLEEYPPGYRERAMTYIRLNQWRSALSDLQKAFKLNPYSSTTLSYLALVESKLGMKSEASKHIRAAINNKSLAAIIYVNQAGVELNMGSPALALKYVDRAIAQDRYLKEAYEMRASIEAKLKDQAGADQDSAEAKKLISHLDY